MYFVHDLFFHPCPRNTHGFVVTLLRSMPSYLWHKFQLVASKLTKREVTASEREYWARRSVGSSTWDDLDAETRCGQ